MKINESGIEHKAVSASVGNAFELEDNITDGIVNQQLQPRLLTSLFLGGVDDIRLSQNVVKFDEVFETLQLPNGKAFQDYGNDLQKDKPRQHIYEIGSKGLRFNVAPRDYMGKRIPNTVNELMDETYIVSKMMEKAGKSWSAEKELTLAQLITTDTNRTAGGPAPVYNFYTDIVGSARPAKIDMDLGGTGDVWQKFTAQSDLLTEDIERTGNSFNGTICVCGQNFFNKRVDLERQVTLARDFVRPSFDLQTQAVPTMGDGGGIFRYQNFESLIDGVLYVRYNAQIAGSVMIGTNDAYMMPMGADNMFREAFAPAETREYVNQVALPMYAWSKENDRTGVTMAQESNSLIMNVAPTLIRALNTTT